MDHDPKFGNPPFEGPAQYFGIWHEHKRGAHRGLHEFYWRKETSDALVYVLLLNVYDRISGNYKELKPPHIPFINPNQFR